VQEVLVPLVVLQMMVIEEVILFLRQSLQWVVVVPLLVVVKVAVLD
jgi:hypothetical protein